jgi:putative transposase
MACIPDKDAKCRAIEALIASGRGVTESCREYGITEKTLYRWRQAQARALAEAGQD